MLKLLILFLFPVIGTVLILLMFRSNRKVPTNSSAPPPLARLAGYLAEGERYRVYVITESSEARLITLSSESPGVLVDLQGNSVQEEEIRAYFITYPSGQSVDEWNSSYPFPEGVKFLGTGIE